MRVARRNPTMKLAKSMLRLLLVAMLPFTTAAAQSSAEMPSMDIVREWIAQHHANVFRDTTENAVIIIVDTNAKYVKSVATRVDSAEVAAVDSGWTRVARLMATREGRLNDDTLWMSCWGKASTPPVSGQPICIVDGARVSGFDVLRQLGMRDLEIVRGAAASARYGADAANGVVVAKTNPTTVARLEGLGVTATNSSLSRAIAFVLAWWVRVG